MPRSEVDRLPLTAAQQGVWIGQQLNPANPLYNAAEYLQIDGPLDTVCFAQALRQAVAECEAFHVRFEAGPHGVAQLLQPPDEWSLPVVDVSDEADPSHAALALMQSDLQTVVDLKKGPLFAHTLFGLAPDRFWWYHRTHHIALDGYSFSLIASRTAQLYTAFVTGSPCTAPRLGSLRVAVDDDLAYQNSIQHDADRDFWCTRFADLPNAVSLSGRVSVPAGRLLRRSSRLAAQAMDDWRALADQNGATWAEVVLAVVALYLHRHTGAAEVILGVPIMGRLGSVAARTPVMLMNVVPLRVPVGAGAALPDVVRAVVDEMRAMRPHQRYRGEQLRRDLRLVGGGQRLFGPLVNVMPFDYGLDFAGRRAVARNLSAGAAFVEDLAIHLYARADGEPPVLDIDANPNCYSSAALAGHLDQLMDLLTYTCARARTS
jgi:nonribosomal peptide synthetase MxcG